MTSLLGALDRGYTWLMSKGDPRISDWPLMSTPFPILSIIALYVYTVKVLGPRFMKHRPPYQIESVIIVYNILMVLASGYFFHYGGQLTYLPPGGRYNFLCQRIDYSLNPESMRLPRLGWWLLLLKMIEFADTLFFVLRKKYTHISALHVVHHSLVPWGFWIGLKFGAGGHNAFFPLINLAVHTVMYSYYCLAALGPKVRKYLWWKRYLTILQMIQFCMALIHACIPLVMDCGFQPFFAYAIIGHAIFFWIMFLNFYRQRYHSKEAVTASENEAKQVVKSSVTSNLKMKPSSNGKSASSNGKPRHSPSPPPRSPQSQLMEAQKAALSHRRLASLTDSPSNSNNNNNSNSNNNSRTANSSAKDR